VTGVLIWLGLAVAQATCPAFTPGPPDAPFRVTQPAAGTLAFEVAVPISADPRALDALLAALDARGHPATLLVDAGSPPALAASLRAAAANGHAVAVRVQADAAGPFSERSRGAYELWWRALRDDRKAVRRAVRAPVRAVALSPMTDPAELAAEQLGLRVVLPLDGGSPQRVRRVRGFDGRSGRARVLAAPLYPDGCGAALPAWTPAALDRAAHDLSPGRPTRVALPLAGADPALLGAWIDGVLAPARVVVTTAADAAAAAPSQPATAAVEPRDRPVDRAMWEAAAVRLVAGGRLPRALPGSLTLTEAFAALVQVAAASPAPETVRLPALGPPVDVARSVLPAAGVPLDPDAVRAVARDLAPRLRGAVPAMVRVGDRNLTAGEFLVVLAHIALDEPPVATAAPPPDPFGDGFGWGRSGAAP